jgi:hypothetical protein
MLFNMDIENHPIPQDITGFQFKLIGSMTIKQFGYLTGGLIIAWVFYISPLFFLLKMLFAFISAVTGASLAFLPINGRPLDVMISHLVNAILRPTQYVYQQSSQDLSEKETKSLKDFGKKRQSISDMSDQQLQTFLKTLPKNTNINKLDQKEMVMIQNLNQHFSTVAPQPTSQTLPSFTPQHAFANQAPQSLPDLPGARRTEPKNVVTPPQPVQPKIIEDVLPKTIPPSQANIQPPPPDNTEQFLEAHQKVLELQQNLSDVQLQKQQLEEKLINLQKQMTTQSQTVLTPQIAKQEPQEAKLVKSVPQNMTKSVGLIAAPEFPNVISGIVKDPRGNPLPNILVEVNDLQGNAIRAFKTNALGQFMSATALGNGDYVIQFEDPRGQNNFETVGFKASGQVIMPLEIISVDTREELRRSLFN